MPQVMDYDLVGSNDEIGHVVIGPLGGDAGERHWREMLDHPEKPVANWHKLVPRWQISFYKHTNILT